MFTPNLSILPEPQRQLWAESLRHRGSGIAHRRTSPSSRTSLSTPIALRASIPYLEHAEMTQFQDNTLSALAIETER